MSGGPLLTGQGQANLYENLGYRKHGTDAEGRPWTRPAETDRFLYNWDQRVHVVICPARASKSYSAAYKVAPLVLGRRMKPDGSGPVPTRGWVVGPCVDERTEILTMRGWLTGDALAVGDTVLTLSAVGLAEWQRCDGVMRYPGTHPMVAMRWRGHDSLTTPHHRWRVGYTGSRNPRPGRQVLGYRFTDTAHLTKPNEFVLTAAPVVNLPAVAKHSDALVELVGWYWTEGTDQPVGTGVLLTQNAGPHADRIRAACTALWGPPSPSTRMRNRYTVEPRWSDWKPIGGQPTCGRFGLNRIAGAQLRAQAPDKVLLPAFLTELTQAQLELLITTSVRADGHARVRTKPSGVQTRDRVVVQRRQDRLSALQMACQLAGVQTTLFYNRTRADWRLQLFERNRIWPGQRPQRRHHVPQTYVGTVWCPKTANGTWLARRNGTVYFTGNSYELAEKEFRYLWTIFKEIGPTLGWGEPMLSRDSKRGGDMYLMTAWGSEIIGKSADKPQGLLGEALDWVLLSEAAQFPPDIWPRYLEPRLATTQGYAILPTTPDANALWLYELYAKGLAGNPRVAAYTWDVFGNPTYHRAEFEQQQAFYGVDHPVFREQYLGEWTFYTGVVYGHDFSVERNVIDLPADGIPADWRRVRAIDFGYRDPFVCLWAALTPDGEIWIYREHYQPTRSTAEHARIIRERSAGESILYTVADSSEPQLITDFSRLGVHAMDANRDRRAGRMLVGDYLRSGRLKFIRGAVPELMRELAWYRWDKDKDKEGAKEATVGDDHAMDALRYLIMSRPRPTTAPVKIPVNSFAAEMQRKSLERARKAWPTLASR